MPGPRARPKPVEVARRLPSLLDPQLHLRPASIYQVNQQLSVMPASQQGLQAGDALAPQRPLGSAQPPSWPLGPVSDARASQSPLVSSGHPNMWIPAYPPAGHPYMGFPGFYPWPANPTAASPASKAVDVTSAPTAAVFSTPQGMLPSSQKTEAVLNPASSRNRSTRQRNKLIRKLSFPKSLPSFPAKKKISRKKKKARNPTDFQSLIFLAKFIKSFFAAQTF